MTDEQINKIITAIEGNLREEVRKETVEYGIPLTSPKLIHNEVKHLFKGCKQEKVLLLTLNNKHQKITTYTVTQGLLDRSPLHPREVFKHAIQANAKSIILAHNHPSGDPTASEGDKRITIRIKECGELLGIELLDHVIVAGEKFISLRSEGYC